MSLVADIPSNETEFAQRYAARLLRDLGREPGRLSSRSEHPALAWARGGLMAVTGCADGAPLMCPSALSACADGALDALCAAARGPALEGVSGAALLGERARLAGLTRAGRVSAGGACRLLQTADGFIAANLARECDWEALPAWLECDIQSDWAAVQSAVRTRPTDELVGRARLLGLAVAPDVAPAHDLRCWFERFECGTRKPPVSDHIPLVVDLSSLWAGPLCAHLLQSLGARVIKVESSSRPDGARTGNAAFYDLLNADKACVALDFSAREDVRMLRTLLEAADIVIESARPRALRQMGLHAEDLIARRPGLTWIGLTGYGRGPTEGNQIAFGDDAAVAAGLTSMMHNVHGARVFCGDAIADPLTGLHAALAAWDSYLRGGGSLMALSLHGVMAHCLGVDRPRDRIARTRRWQTLVDAERFELYPLRRAQKAGRATGADTAHIFAELGVTC